jgi:hypothetical protein
MIGEASAIPNRIFYRLTQPGSDYVKIIFMEKKNFTKVERVAVVNDHAAGIDVGSTSFYVAIGQEPNQVKKTIILVYPLRRKVVNVGPRVIAPILQSDIRLNKYHGIKSKSLKTQ